METRRRREMKGEDLSRFAALYRAACADLALADAYQLPPNTVQYLHRLVGRAHNQLYRTRKFDVAKWRHVLLEDVPRRIFNDRCVQLAFVLFWGVFLLSMALSYYQREFAEQLVGARILTMLQDMHSGTPGEGAPIGSPAMAAFYIQHNTSIGLQCFVGGIFVVPGIAVTIFNAAFLGAAFGFMARPDVAETSNFFHFVTAHGPFELTAIVLSAGAGLRLGMAWLNTKRSLPPADVADKDEQAEIPEVLGKLGVIVFSRSSSLRLAAREMMPVMGAAMVMFFLAALIEGFISPSILPYWTKATVAIVSTVLLVFYFIVLGFPRR